MIHPSKKRANRNNNKKEIMKEMKRKSNELGECREIIVTVVKGFAVAA